MAKKKGRGKAPTGRAASKQKAQRGASGTISSPWSSHFIRGSDWDALDEEDDDGRIGFRGFAQTKSSSNSASRTFLPRNATADTSIRLRHQAIRFVSATSHSRLDSEGERRELQVGEEGQGLDEVSEEREPDDEVEVDVEISLQTNIITEIEEEQEAEDTMKLLNGGELEETEEPEDEILSEAAINAIPEEGEAAKPHKKPAEEEIVHNSGPFIPPNAGLPFVIDTEGDESLRRHFPPKRRVRRPSPTPSTSSGEFVLFRARNPTAITDPVEQPQLGCAEAGTANRSVAKRDKELRDGDRAKGWASGWRDPAEKIPKWAPTPVGNSWKMGPDEPKSPLPKISSALPKSGSEGPMVSRAAETAPVHLKSTEQARADPEAMKIDSAIEPAVEASAAQSAEETIAILQADWKAALRTKNAAKKSASAGEDTISLASKPGRRGKRSRKRGNKALREFLTDDGDDDASEAAYDDYMANLIAEMSDDGTGDKDSAFHRSAQHAPDFSDYKYHGTWTEDITVNTTDMNDSDTSSDSLGPIGEDISEVSSLRSSELEDELEYTEQQQWEDEADLRRRRQEQMTDEHIARIFAKQEELGISGDEMVLDDGDFGDISDRMDGFGDVEAARSGLSKLNMFSRPSKKRGNTGKFPNASAFADTIDQYGDEGFDIMDFDRPSLRNTKNGRKGKLPPELEALSDEELKANMQDAWDNDRNKKRLKKAEREELRRAGLLGSAGKKGKADLGQKYAFGMTTTQVHEELRIFLQDNNQAMREFPPMDKFDRKTLHELAKALNLKSKSAGMGKNRRPVVYKTNQTRGYNYVSFQSALSRSARGLLDSDRKLGGKKGKGSKIPKAVGGTSAATVRNGEVVGTGAAQIGKENKGYMLLAKMGGWKEGMALGKDGEGRLEPVEQVMRAGKSGLGDWH